VKKIESDPSISNKDSDIDDTYKVD
jgi:hypothetical protein